MSEICGVLGDVLFEFWFEVIEDVLGGLDESWVESGLSAAELDGGRMWERISELSAGDGEGQGADPVVEGFAEVIDGEFFEAEEDAGIGVWGELCESNGPARDGFGAWEASSCEGGDSVLEHGV